MIKWNINMIHVEPDAFTGCLQTAYTYSVCCSIMSFAYTLWKSELLIRVKQKVCSCSAESSRVLQLLPPSPLSSHFNLIAISDFVSGCWSEHNHKTLYLVLSSLCFTVCLLQPLHLSNNTQQQFWTFWKQELWAVLWMLPSCSPVMCKRLMISWVGSRNQSWGVKTH